MNIGSLFRAILVVASLAGGATANAQRVLTVQEQYGPGRSPYLVTQIVPLTVSVCTGSSGSSAIDWICKIPFPAVPSGKRLVISHVSLYYSVNDTQQLHFGGVAIGASESSMLYLPGSFAAGSLNGSDQRLISSGPVTYYFEEGSVPLVMITGSRKIVDGADPAHATIVGFLVPSS